MFVGDGCLSITIDYTVDIRMISSDSGFCKYVLCAECATFFLWNLCDCADLDLSWLLGHRQDFAGFLTYM